MEQKNNRKLVIVILLAGLLLLFAGFYFSASNNEQIDVLPEEGTSVDFTTQARIIEGDELFQQLTGFRQFDSLSEDLFVFAKEHYGVYTEQPDRVVGFLVQGESKKEDGVITFSGRYGASENKIVVTVKLLKNERIHTVIKDTQTGAEMEEGLPSNSKENTFLGSLPYSNDQFKIEYNPSVDAFVITALTPSADTRTKAIQHISDESGRSLESIKTVFRPYLF